MFQPDGIPQPEIWPKGLSSLPEGSKSRKKACIKTGLGFWWLPLRKNAPRHLFNLTCNLYNHFGTHGRRDGSTFQVIGQVCIGTGAQSKAYADDVSDGFGFDFNGGLVQIDTAWPPAVPITAQVSKVDMSQLVAERGKATARVQGVMHD